MIKIINADVLAGLKTLPDKSIQMVITSPPYYNLRDYSRCDCATRRQYSETMRTFDGADRTDGVGGNLNPNDARCRKDPDPNCKKCGGTGVIKGMEIQIGLEKTPDAYVQKMVDVFREIKRVLRDDGTAWLNLGDCYSGSGGAGGDYAEGGLKEGQPKYPGRNIAILKPKDLCMIPARVAMTLQADGWFLRSQIPWLKKNPMPDSCTDRPSSAVEYIFLLTKNRNYYYDQDAIKMPVAESTIVRANAINSAESRKDKGEATQQGGLTPGQQDKYYAKFRDGSQSKAQASLIPKQDLTGNPTYTGFNKRWKDKEMALIEGRTGDGHSGCVNADGSLRFSESGRTRRNSDWFFESWKGLYSEGDDPLAMLVNPQPFPESHFAVFPESLVSPCIKAGTSEYGCCPKCGSPWERIVEMGEIDRETPPKREEEIGNVHGRHMKSRVNSVGMETVPRKMVGWQPTCKCGENSIVPCVVLDPFGGSGTTGKVARDLKRDAVLIELNPEYVEIMKKRLRLNEQLGFD